MILGKPKDDWRNTHLRITTRSILRRSHIQGFFLRALILIVWLLGVPGLRPVYHHHRDDGANGADGASATELVRLSEHLRHYVHLDSTDTAKLHFHWLVQLDGPVIPEFPNVPQVAVVSHAAWFLESCGISVAEKSFLDFALQATLDWLSLPRPDLASEGLTRIARLEDSRASEQARRLCYSATLYRTSRL